MNGTTRCPHCETRFKITEAQFTAHQGMVRCGHCMQAFDSRPTFIPAQQPDSHFELAGTKAKAVRKDTVQQAGELHDVESDAMQAVATEVPNELDSVGSTVTDERNTAVPEVNTPDHAIEQNSGFASIHPEEAEFHIVDLAEPLPAVDTIDLADKIADHHLLQDSADVIPAGETPFSVMLAMDKQTVDESPVEAAKRRIWPWALGIAVSVSLLLAQSAYFFRVGLTTHVPAIKPALVIFCHALHCTIPLPQSAELISIESSGLEADPEHENQIAFTALLRNRADFTQSFPELALTLNDNQDNPVARRFFKPRDYLPADENTQTAFLANHELSVKLQLNTGNLRPAGYRLELFYSK